jgi:hypothetical protein
MDRLNAMQVLLTVVDEGSLSATSRKLRSITAQGSGLSGLDDPKAAGQTTRAQLDLSGVGASFASSNNEALER